MPTSSQASASSRRASTTKPGPPPRASSAAPPLPARFPSHSQAPLPSATTSRRGSAIPELIGTRRDSSIGATSTNPRLRGGSVIDAAAAQRSSSAPRNPIDFASKESQEAMNRLRRLFLPVMMRVILRFRRRSRWKDGQPPRQYTPGSVVAAIMSTKSLLADCPQRMVESLAAGATFMSLTPKEIIVYANESHVSCGIVVLLYGQLEERRPEPGGKKPNAGGGGGSTRPICTQPHRLHKAMSVLCLMPVMCEDRATSFLATRESEEADVAIISSRWFWEVTYSMAQASLTTADVMGRTLREVVLPHRRDLLLADYFPTSVVLLRSWMWSMLTASDRVKLSRSMEVRVLSVGDVLFDEGDYCPYIYVVRRGALAAIVKGETLAVLEAGAAVGEESVLFHDRRNCRVVAITVCELYALHAHHLLRRFLKYPESARRIVAAAIERQVWWMEEGRTRDVFGLVSILSGVPCLGHTTDAMRDEIARCASVLILPQGHTVVSANTPCTFFCVIGRGSVTLISSMKTAAVAETPSSVNGIDSKGESQLGMRRSSAMKPMSNPATEMRRESRSAGDFFGELCLKPHLWPYDVMCDSTVSLWQFDREAVLGVLERNRADAQALEVCRQGIGLYRTQRGETSIIDGFEPPATPNAPANGWRSCIGGQRSRAQSTDFATAPPGARSSSAGSRTPRGGRRAGVEWTPEQWTTYAMTRLQDGLRAEDAKETPPAPSRELRGVDKEVEKTMNEKVLQLVAVQPETPPNPADCDISGDSSELQSIIVGQLFLIMTEKQSRFLRQVKDSNVRLITEDEGMQLVGELNDSLDDMSGMDALHNSEALVEVTEVMQLEDISASPLEGSHFLPQRAMPSLSVRDSTDATDYINVHRVDDALSVEGSGGALAGWPMPNASIGRTRRSTSVGALGEASGVLGASLNPRSSLNRSHFVRPSSAVPPSPRCASGRDDFLSPGAIGVVRPASSSEPRMMPPARTRPASVDFNQFNNKLSVDRSTSMLDRYVKIEDQNYFDSFVKVLPLQRDEMWAPDGVNTDSEMGTGSMVLLLLHVRKCDYLSAKVMQRCARPIVKVTLGERVLVRTSVMENRTAPRWPIEHSSFISFVRRGTDIVFSVCDAGDECRIVYQASFSTASIHENGGVEQRTMPLTELSVTGFPANAEMDADVKSVESVGRMQRSAKKPRMTMTMLAVTANKYKALRQYLETKEKVIVDPPGTPESTKLFLQVMSVEGLKHRIEATVTASLYNGATSTTVLKTERVIPKTRSPAWPGDTSFVIISGEGGILSFDLHHRDAVIGSTETTVDELIFGGVGLRRLPLLQAQTGRLVIGHLVVGVLGARLGDSVESRNRDWVTHLAVEELSLAREGFSINPDPFIVLRSGTGAELMRTPLAFSAFEASWSMSEASCLLQCPRLCGSTVSYQLEVCDSDEKEVIGRATILLSDRGLGPGHLHDLSLDPPGRGVVRLRSLCLPVLELPARGAAGKASSAAALCPPFSSHLHLSESATLLLLHMGGCTNLPGGATVELQIDAIGTLSVDAQPYLRTAVQEATTALQWPLSKASVLLRIPSRGDVDDRAAEAVDLRQWQCGHQCHFAVYDGVVDDVSQIGQVAVPLSQLLNTALHTYPLFPRCMDADGGGLDQQPSVGTTTRPRAAAERTLGNLQVFTLLGSLDHQVRGTAEQETDTLLTSVPAAGGHAPPDQLPYYNPESADITAARLASALPTTVVLSVSNICHVLPSASEKYVQIVVRRGATVVLSVERQMGVLSHAEWSPTEASAVVSCGALPADAALVVELVAMDVVEGRSDEEEDGITPSAAGAKAESTARDKTRRRTITKGNASAANLPLGHAELPVSRLSSVQAGEVRVVTLMLSRSQRSSSLSETTGRLPRVTPSMCALKDAQVVWPTVSFCIFGNRA
ncbi:Cyclic nucleotide-binding domain family protein [Leishmania donovani]|uniref:Cyclic nucleotide-binding domain family protein n=1 Tax=Leishmania donovani TaxID=5661 RepID=A0A504XIP0_LEIDO|nr:Cyclic nucleotide-binding domain family protein [Leishmania donovani]